MTAKGAVAPHLAAQLAGRVLLGAAKDNNSGNRQLAAGNRGGIRTTVIKAKAATAGTGNRQPGWNTDHGHKGKGGNWELAIGSDEPYQKSASSPGTGRSCRLFLHPVA